MSASLHQLWKFMNTPVSKLFSTATVTGGIEAAKAVFDLAETLDQEKKNSQKIASLVGRTSTLIDALNSPLGQVVSSSLPFISIATGLLKFYLDFTKEEPTLAQCVALVTQAAYLDSLKDTLAQERDLLETVQNSKSSALEKQISQLGDLELEDKQARIALVNFSQSKLAPAFNQILSARLQEIGVSQARAEDVADRVARKTQEYIKPALAEAGDGVKRLVDWYSLGGQQDFEKYLSIDTYLEKSIKSLPSERVFDENFTYQDIYIPLKANILDANGKEVKNKEPFVLEDWAKQILQDPNKSHRVIFIQAGPGRGKSLFCRMFADWVRQNWHPKLTPILIRLRDIESFQPSFEKTLTDALSHLDFVSTDPGWLTDPKTQFLFLLDGFDELRIEGRISGGLERFLQQVGHFQERFKTPETGHRVILTGRPLALQGISYLPPNLERVKLLEMDEELQHRWLEKWQQVVDANATEAEAKTQTFREFLQADECPREVRKELAKEPLLLYLLAAMHRDGRIKLEEFQLTRGTQAKILIYEESLEWVISKQRPKWLQYQLLGVSENKSHNDTLDSLRHFLSEAGLCVVQSGGEYAKVEMIESRLDRSERKILQQLKDKKQGEKALTTALAAFYLRPASGESSGGVEFYHKSFAEFLCARRLKESLEEWTELRSKSKRQHFYMEDEQLAGEIYDLLGYGGLTPEIIEYLMGLLVKSEEFRPVELFQRLEDFYWRWCDGEFIDAEGTTLPQTKMRQLKTYLPEQTNYWGQRQVDVYAGLNVMILLLELHRFAHSGNKGESETKMIFYPCGKPNEQGELEDPILLLRLIGYSQCIGDNGFLSIVGRYLEGANLRGVHLRGANLRGANLKSVNLAGADLRSANFIRASLRGADLRGADLRGADLRGADLRGADLRGTDLFRVDLRGANLKSADLRDANLLNIISDEQTQWQNVKGEKPAQL